MTVSHANKSKWRFDTRISLNRRWHANKWMFIYIYFACQPWFEFIRVPTPSCIYSRVNQSFRFITGSVLNSDLNLIFG